MRRLLCALLALTLALGLTACEKPAPAPVQPVKYEYTCWDVFDTVTTVQGYAGSQQEWDEAMALFHDLLLEYHMLYDIYNEYDGMVNLATVNRMAGQGPVEVDDKILDLLSLARKVYTLTGGKTNVAAGAVLRLWHDTRTDALDNPDKTPTLPAPGALETAAAHCRIEDVVLDRESSTVEILDPDLQLDVGSIGKGYAAEMAARAVREFGIESAYFNVGGNSRTIGRKPDGSSWVAGLENPWKEDKDLGAYLDAVCVSDLSLVVSGDYQRFYTVDGVRYHHLIDLDTLYPAGYANSVAVICADSGLADGLSTGLFCMPVEDGLALAESLDGVEAKWLLPDRTARETSGWTDYLRKN